MAGKVRPHHPPETKARCDELLRQNATPEQIKLRLGVSDGFIKRRRKAIRDLKKKNDDASK